MAEGSLGKVLGHIRRAALGVEDGGPSDEWLLGRFVTLRDPAAFEELVLRHGGMVLGVCRRVLGNAHDAEDAFQAAFLVLARKAASLRRPDLVGNFLYGVAHRIARQVKRASACRRVKEARAAKPEAAPPGDRGEWREVLDQELSRLPTVYRTALVLCDLEGLSRQESARRLGWPEGTLSGRLSRARKLLAQRLARRGYSFPVGLLATLVAAGAGAAPPGELVGPVVQAAVQAVGGAAAGGLASASFSALTTKVIQAMLTIKLKVATLVLLGVAVVLLVGGLLFCSVVAQTAPARPTSFAKGGWAPPGIPSRGPVATSAAPEGSGGGLPDGLPLMGRRPAPPRTGLPPLRILNKELAKLDFEVGRVGPSGLGGVDVYVTTDEGASWEKLSAKPLLEWPAEGKGAAPVSGTVTVALPKEAVAYGFRLVVKNRAGFGQAAPRPGDLPQVRVERDTTPPTAELFTPQPAPDRPNGVLLTWKAEDRNLAAKPVSLEWSATEDGAWTLIGEARLPNTGKWTWVVPENAPAKVYLRLTVRDAAGNTAVAKTDKPVLIDLFVPGDVTIKGARFPPSSPRHLVKGQRIPRASAGDARLVLPISRRSAFQQPRPAGVAPSPTTATAPRRATVLFLNLRWVTRGGRVTMTLRTSPPRAAPGGLDHVGNRTVSREPGGRVREGRQRGADRATRRDGSGQVG
jgi:RNA polymerase sigma factor (sigma-70 family)